MSNLDYDVDLSEGVITFKNINTTLGFVRYNETAEVEYIFVNPMFRRQGLAKKLLSIVEEKTKIKPTPQDLISPLGEKHFKINKQEINWNSGAPGNRKPLFKFRIIVYQQTLRKKPLRRLLRSFKTNFK
jgi:GNAT superfamily N-acetyltransferase